MLPDPLHPAVVHLPLALAVLMPLLSLLAALSIRADAAPRRVWLVILLLQALLVGSAWFAGETGEEQDERVERIVAERHIEAHHEAAERMLLAAAVVLAIAAAGLLGGGPGGVARIATVVASLVVLAAALQVGHRGGELVYRYGAANAYVDQDAPGPAAQGADHHDHSH